MKMGKMVKSILVVSIALLTFTGCVEPPLELNDTAAISGSASEIAAFIVTSPSFTLAWNPADQGEYTETLQGYNVYYRTHGAETWEILSTVDLSDEPQIEINDSMLTMGDYDFAVSAYTTAEESDLHTSLDDTADPETGWYLEWHA